MPIVTQDIYKEMCTFFSDDNAKTLAAELTPYFDHVLDKKIIFVNSLTAMGELCYKMKEKELTERLLASKNILLSRIRDELIKYKIDPIVSEKIVLAVMKKFTPETNKILITISEDMRNEFWEQCKNFGVNNIGFNECDDLQTMIFEYLDDHNTIINGYCGALDSLIQRGFGPLLATFEEHLKIVQVCCISEQKKFNDFLNKTVASKIENLDEELKKKMQVALNNVIEQQGSHTDRNRLTEEVRSVQVPLIRAREQYLEGYCEQAINQWKELNPDITDWSIINLEMVSQSWHQERGQQFDDFFLDYAINSLNRVQPLQ